MYGEHRDLHLLTHTLPTRRSSDLERDQFHGLVRVGVLGVPGNALGICHRHDRRYLPGIHRRLRDLVRQPGGSSPQETDHAGIERGILRSLRRSEEHTTELQTLMRITSAVLCFKQKNTSNLTITP